MTTVSHLMKSMMGSAQSLTTDTADFLEGLDATDPVAMLQGQFKMGAFTATLTAFSNATKAVTDMATSEARNLK